MGLTKIHTIMIKEGSKVKRKDRFYKGITGKVISLSKGKATVQWKSQTGTRVKQPIKTTLKLSALLEA